SCYPRVRASPPDMVLMLYCSCTNETHCFREPAAFGCPRTRVFPEWAADADAGKRGKTLRIWSAACSTGEEAYSLAMAILTYFPPSGGWSVEVLGTDLTTKVLARAASGIWPADTFSSVPIAYQRRFRLNGFGPDTGTLNA